MEVTWFGWTILKVSDVYRNGKGFTKIEGMLNKTETGEKIDQGSNLAMWGESIYSPFDGIVVRINNGVSEREPVSIIKDLMYQNRMNNDIRNGILNMGNIAGNYIIIRNTENIFGLFAHLKLNSILVKKNEHVTAGQKIGLIGHSGNSMAPHLHFQLTDSSDYNSVKGISCCFKTLEYYVNGVWTTKLNTIPKKKDRIRYNEKICRGLDAALF